MNKTFAETAVEMALAVKSAGATPNLVETVSIAIRQHEPSQEMTDFVKKAAKGWVIQTYFSGFGKVRWLAYGLMSLDQVKSRNYCSLGGLYYADTEDFMKAMKMGYKPGTPLYGEEVIAILSASTADTPKIEFICEKTPETSVKEEKEKKGILARWFGNPRV
jgi:hypothetical protein